MRGYDPREGIISKKSYRVNQLIKASEVRVLDSTGKQLGVFPLSEALQMAQYSGVDLVEVAGQAVPPVCKLIDFKKFKYLEAKRESDSKKSSRQVDTKEIRLRPFTSDNDLEVRLKRIREFLIDGDRVKVVVKFMGREIARPEFGTMLINKITAFVEEQKLGKIDKLPKFEGKNLVVSYVPLK